LMRRCAATWTRPCVCIRRRWRAIAAPQRAIQDVTPACVPDRGGRRRVSSHCRALRAETIEGESMRPYAVARTVQAGAIRSGFHCPRQIRHRAAVFTEKMVVLLQHPVKSCRPIGQMQHPQLLLFGQLLQIAVHGAQADAWQAPTCTVADLFSGWMIVRGGDDLVYGRELAVRRVFTPPPDPVPTSAARRLDCRRVW